MYTQVNYETMKMMLRNPIIWGAGILRGHQDFSRGRILLAKLGVGYGEAMTSLALAFRDAGYEVIYTDIQRPGAIVASAIQECVDHIGITTLPGADITDLARVVELLKKEDSSHIRVTAGGYLERDKIAEVKEMGVVEFFAIGTPVSELIEWAREYIRPT